MFSERILRAQSGSQEDMLFIIQKFEPQLKHYSRRLHSEDAQSELTLRFIETIHAMNLDSLRSQGDGTIVAYLAQSVRNAYISLLPFKKTVEPPVSWEELTEAQLLGLVAPIREREVLDFSELLDTCPELTKKERKVLTLDRLESRHQSKGLSAKTVRNIHQIISSAMQLAREQKLITANPAEDCALPRLEHREMQTLPVEQLQSFLREAKDSGVFELYYLELTTGLRRGELLGLKWEDIDLERGDLRVRRQIARINGEVVEAPLKTKNAYRTLPLAEDTIGVLEAQRKKTGDSPWVFPSPTGGPISPDSVLRMLHRVLKRAGLPRVRFHDLRHTFATLALQNGVDVKTVSGMLGHFSAGFTLDTYAHVTTASQRQAAKTMGNLLSSSLQT